MFGMTGVCTQAAPAEGWPVVAQSKAVGVNGGIDEGRRGGLDPACPCK